jgi:hypothetical protein
VFVVNPVSRALQNSAATNRLTSPQVFNSSRVQSSARTIVGVSQTRLASAGATTLARMRNIAPSTSPSSPPGQIRSSQPMRVAEAGARTFSPPSPRVFSPPVVSQGRVFSAPPVVSRGSNGGGSRGGGGGRR